MWKIIRHLNSRFPYYLVGAPMSVAGGDNGRGDDLRPSQLLDPRRTSTVFYACATSPFGSSGIPVQVIPRALHAGVTDDQAHEKARVCAHV
jgi:hypothetical protein